MEGRSTIVRGRMRCSQAGECSARLVVEIWGGRLGDRMIALSSCESTGDGRVLRFRAGDENREKAETKETLGVAASKHRVENCCLRATGAGTSQGKTARAGGFASVCDFGSLRLAFSMVQRWRD